MKRIFIFISLCISYLTQTSLVMAQASDRIHLGSKQRYGIPALNNPNATVGNIVGNGVKILFIAGGLAVLVFFIWGAFDWITAGGDKEKIGAARRKIVNSFIGLALLALSYFIVSLFGQIVGFNPLNTPPLPRLDQAP
jgi:hypothetical protein